MKIRNAKLYNDNWSICDEKPNFVLCCCDKKKRANTFNFEGERPVFYASGNYTPYGKPSADENTWSHIVKSQKYGGTKAYELYTGNKIYNYAYNKLGDRLFILSSGWGIMPATFKLPMYHITWAQNARGSTMFRDRNDARWEDWTLDDHNIKDDGHYMILLAGRDYIRQFLHCTSNIKKRCIVYNADIKCYDENVKYIWGQPYLNNPNQIINWHYTALRNMLS